MVDLASRDPRAAPRIDSGLLSDSRDAERMRFGVGHALEIVRAMNESVHAELLLPDTATAEDAELLAEHVRRFHSTGYHPSGTCRIGHVVDARCDVIGVRDLTVADASVMPSVPRANTNLPTLMIGERVADLVKEVI